MTTVAFSAGLMACDSCFSFNGIVDTLSTKIHRTRAGALLGQAGDNDAREVIALFEGVKTPKQLPTRTVLQGIRTEFMGLLVLPSGRMFKISTCLVLPENEKDDLGIWEVEMPFTAIGTGKEFALGAMAAGANAIQAVRIACRYDMNSRPPIRTAALKPEKKGAKK